MIKRAFTFLFLLLFFLIKETSGKNKGQPAGIFKSGPRKPTGNPVTFDPKKEDDLENVLKNLEIKDAARKREETNNKIKLLKKEIEPLEEKKAKAKENQIEQKKLKEQIEILKKEIELLEKQNKLELKPKEEIITNGNDKENQQPYANKPPVHDTKTNRNDNTDIYFVIKDAKIFDDQKKNHNTIAKTFEAATKNFFKKNVDEEGDGFSLSDAPLIPISKTFGKTKMTKRVDSSSLMKSPEPGYGADVENSPKKTKKTGNPKGGKIARVKKVVKSKQKREETKSKTTSKGLKKVKTSSKKAPETTPEIELTTNTDLTTSTEPTTSTEIPITESTSELSTNAELSTNIPDNVLEHFTLQEPVIDPIQERFITSDPPVPITENPGITTGQSFTGYYGGGFDDITVEDYDNSNDNSQVIIDNNDHYIDNINDTIDNITIITEDKIDTNLDKNDKIVPEPTPVITKVDPTITTVDPITTKVDTTTTKVDTPPTPAPVPTNTKSALLLNPSTASATNIPASLFPDTPDLNYTDARTAHLRNLKDLEGGLQSVLFYTAALVALLIVAYSAYYIAVLRKIYRRKVSDLRRRKRSMQVEMEEAHESEMETVIEEQE